jgi:hypothetical protein
LAAGFYDITNLGKVGIPFTYQHFYNFTDIGKLCQLLGSTKYGSNCHNITAFVRVYHSICQGLYNLTSPVIFGLRETFTYHQFENHVLNQYVVGLLNS